MSIRTRVTLFGVGIVTLVIVCLSVSLFALIAHGMGPDQDDRLATRADQAVASLLTASRADFAPRRSLTPIDPRSSVDIFVMVLGPDGGVLGSTSSVNGEPITVPASLLAEAVQHGRAVASLSMPGGAAKETVRVHVRAWSRTDLSMSGFVVAGQTSRRITQDRAALVVLFILSGMVTFVGATVAVWMATGRALRPLRTMATLADEVGQSQDLGRRLPAVRPKDAVGRLTTSFNLMMDRLAQAYARVASALAAQQQFTADASHELRTPLTTIRNNAEFLLQHPAAKPADSHAALTDIVGESVRMSRLIDNLLTLARADGGVEIRQQPIDLVAIASSVCRQAAALHPSRTIQFTSTPSGPVLGDGDMLRQLLWILVDNAVKFTVDGGLIWVSVAPHGDHMELSVADNGTGIPPAALAHIFDRFYRADQARSGVGAGLGLAIATWIVRVHHGAIVAANNDRGGASFRVELPIQYGAARSQPEPPTNPGSLIAAGPHDRVAM